MVVHYFYLLRVACPPKKADPPLVINPDAVLTLPISLQCFKSVRGWQTKIFQYGGSIYRVELHERALLNSGRKLPREPPMENSLGFPAAERLDHRSIVNNAFTRRQGLNKGEICSRSLSLWMRLVIHLDQLLHRNVSVDLGGRKTRVAQQFLNVPQVSATVEQVRGERMTQGMRTDVVDARAKAYVLFDQPSD